MLVFPKFYGYFLARALSTWAIAAAEAARGRLSMIPNLSSGDRVAAPFEAFSDRAGPTPWSALSWGVLVPVVLVGNVALAIVAWYAVEFTMKLF